MRKLAVLSSCGAFRYWLERHWDAALPRMCIVMLNPSTADAEQDDPTIKRCVEIAKHNLYGAIEVVNLFAFRATDPKDLRKAGWPTGSWENNDHIAKTASRCAVTVCAWGGGAKTTTRPDEVLSNLRRLGVRTKAFAITPHGHPQHPLYVPIETVLVDFPCAGVSHAIQ